VHLFDILDALAASSSYMPSDSLDSLTSVLGVQDLASLGCRERRSQSEVLFLTAHIQ